MNERFDELLPWYVNGTLGADDKAWVDQYLAEHPDAQAELDWYRSLQSGVLESAPAVPETIGLARTLRLIHGDQPSLAERISAFFGNFGLRPGMALAGLAVFALQGGVIYSLLNETHDDAAEIRSLRATAVTDGPLLKISFTPDAKEVDIRMLLVSLQGRLSGGPGQLGDYYVRVPAGKEDLALEQLKANPIVQAAALAAGLPPSE